MKDKIINAIFAPFKFLYSLTIPHVIMESFFTALLYSSMFVLIYIIWGILIDSGDFTPALLIGMSALTAAFAMSRSVYSSKVSDQEKLNRELVSTRLDIYAELSRILNLAMEGKHSQEDNEKLYKIYAKSRVLLGDNVTTFLTKVRNDIKIVEKGIARSISKGPEHAKKVDKLTKAKKDLGIARGELKGVFKDYIKP